MRLAWLVVVAAGCGLSQPPPTLRAIMPGSFCGGTPTQLTLSGDGFVALPSGVLGAASVALPTVTLDGPMTLVLADDAAGASGPVTYVSTQALTVEVDAAPAGSYTVALTNPDGQTSTLAGALAATVGPQVTAINPSQLCDQAGGSIDLTGAGFVAGATVALVDPASRMTLAGTLVVHSDTSATATFGAVPFAKNLAVDLVVTNPDGCTGTLAGQLRIKPGQGGC